jgi:hypothetical protein
MITAVAAATVGKEFTDHRPSPATVTIFGPPAI